MKIKRYNPDSVHWMMGASQEMVEDELGKYVTWEDHLASLDHLARTIVTGGEPLQVIPDSEYYQDSSPQK